MQQIQRALLVGEVIPENELLSHIGSMFELFSYDKCFCALWEIMQAYSNPKYKTNEEMVQDEKCQIMIHFIDLFADLYKTWVSYSSEQHHAKIVDISPGDHAA